MSEVYLVTGATGNLGSNIVKMLVENNRKVKALVRQASITKLDPGVEPVIGDLQDVKSLEGFFTHEQGDELYVIHCASVVTIDPDFNQLVYDVNVIGTRNMIEQSLKAQVKKFVYISSIGAIPELPQGIKITEVSHFDPDKVRGYYSKTKAMASQAVMDAINNQGLDGCLIFPSGIIGPYDYGYSLTTQTIIAAAKGQVQFAVDGTFNAVDVRDLAQAIIKCTHQGGKGEGYILANELIPMREFYGEIARVANAPQVRYYLSPKVALVVAAFMKAISAFTGKPPQLTSFMIYNLVRNNSFDTSKAREILDFNPRPLRETIIDEVEWLKQEKKI